MNLNPTIELPRWAVDAVRLLAVVCTALAPFAAEWHAFAAVAAVVTAVAAIVTARAAVTPVADPDQRALLDAQLRRS